MDEKLKKFIADNLDELPVQWSRSTQADELTQWAIEAGFGDIPEEASMTQKEFDRYVEDGEDVYDFLRAEIYHYLSNRTFRDIVLEKAQKGE